MSGVKTTKASGSASSSSSAAASPNVPIQTTRKTSIAQDSPPEDNVELFYREQSPSTITTKTATETTHTIVNTIIPSSSPLSSASSSSSSASSSASRSGTTRGNMNKNMGLKTEKIPEKTDSNPFFYLKWNDFDKQLTSGFSNLFHTQEFADVTLSCEGKSLLAHKVVLAMCSTYFRSVLLENPCKHPVVIIKGITYHDLQNILEFVYFGQVSVVKNEIPDFIHAAEFIGLDGISSDHCRVSSNFSRSKSTPLSGSNTSLESISSVHHHQHQQRNVSLSVSQDEASPSSRLPPPSVIVPPNNNSNMNKSSSTSNENNSHSLSHSHSHLDYTRTHSPAQSSTAQYHENPYSPSNSNPPSASSVSSSCSLSHDVNTNTSTNTNTNTNVSMSHHHHHPSQQQQQQQHPSNLSVHHHQHQHHMKKKKYGQWTSEEHYTSNPLSLSAQSSQSQSHSQSSTLSPNSYSRLVHGKEQYQHQQAQNQNQNQHSRSTLIDVDPCHQSESRMSLDSSSPGEYELSILPRSSTSSPYVHLKSRTSFTTPSGMVVTSTIPVRPHQHHQHQLQRSSSQSSDTWLPAGQVVTPVITNVMGSFSSPSPSPSVLEGGTGTGTGRTGSSSSRSFRPIPSAAAGGESAQFQNGPIPIIPKLAFVEPQNLVLHRHGTTSSSISPSAHSAHSAAASSSFSTVLAPAKKRFSHLNNTISTNKYPIRPHPHQHQHQHPDIGSGFSSSSENHPVDSHHHHPHSRHEMAKLVGASSSSSSIGSIPCSSSSTSSSTSSVNPALAMVMATTTSMSMSMSSVSSDSLLRPVVKYKNQRHSQVPQSARYTTAEVDRMVDSVTNHLGPFVPCSICDKLVKRERLRAHIHECHLVSGEKIICPFCGVGLKSKGSYRVHVWRHRRGVLSKGLKNKKALMLTRAIQRNTNTNT